MNNIFIPGNVPSSKNSKIATKHGVFHSKTVQGYLKNLGIKSYSVSKKWVSEYKTRPNLFKEYVKDFPELIKGKEAPFLIGIHFIRDSKRKFDFHNAVQIIADLMVAHDLIEDDNMDYFLPIPMEVNGKYYTIDKEKTGVIIQILN